MLRAVSTFDWSKTKTTKTDRPRVIDIDTETLGVLAGHRSERAGLSLTLVTADAFIFGDDQGRLRSPDAMTSRWDRRMVTFRRDHPEIGRLTIKGLRHTHATLLLELGERPKVVQERLGHSTFTTTMNTYSHVSPTVQRAAIDRLADRLRGS